LTTTLKREITRTRRVQIGLTVLAFVVLLLLLIPLFWMISSSVKSEKDIVTMRWIPSELKVENYRIILERAKIGRWFINSAVVSVCATTGIVVISLLAGYSLGRLEFPGKNFLFFLTLSGFMIPIHSIMIPLFLLMKTLGFLNSYWALILPALASSISVFIITQFFKGIPKEYEEAARLDGVNELQILLYIMTPMALPAIITIAIFNFNYNWNDFLWPLIIAQSDEMYTLPVGLITLAGSDVNIRFGPVMAANVLASITVVVLYIIFQRYLASGIAVGGGFK